MGRQVKVSIFNSPRSIPKTVLESAWKNLKESKRTRWVFRGGLFLSLSNTLHTIHHTQCSATPHTIHHTLHSTSQYTLHSTSHYTLHHTPHNILYTIYSVYYTPYTVVPHTTHYTTHHTTQHTTLQTTPHYKLNHTLHTRLRQNDPTHTLHIWNPWILSPLCMPFPKLFLFSF